MRNTEELRKIVNTLIETNVISKSQFDGGLKVVDNIGFKAAAVSTVGVLIFFIPAGLFLSVAGYFPDALTPRAFMLLAWLSIFAVSFFIMKKKAMKHNKTEK